MNRKNMLLVIPAILLIATLIGGCSSPAPSASSPTPTLNPLQPAANDTRPVPEAMNSTLANLSRIQAGLDEIKNTLSLAEPGSINQTTLDAYQAEIDAYMAEINNISMASQQYLNESGLATEPGVSAPPVLSSPSDSPSGINEWMSRFYDVKIRLTALENEIKSSKPGSMNWTVKMEYISKVESIMADIRQLQNDYSIDPNPPGPMSTAIPYGIVIGGPLVSCDLAQLQLRCVNLEWDLGGFF